MTWSDEPPIEDGWYWLKSIPNGLFHFAEKCHDVWWIGGSDWSFEWVAKNFQFGPRVPTPEELEALREDVSMLLNHSHAGPSSPLWPSAGRLLKFTEGRES